MVIEGPLSNQRTNAVVAEIHKLFPNKPIRGRVNTTITSTILAAARDELGRGHIGMHGERGVAHGVRNRLRGVGGIDLDVLRPQIEVIVAAGDQRMVAHMGVKRFSASTYSSAGDYLPQGC
jgi:hypothetical protein